MGLIFLSIRVPRLDCHCLVYNVDPFRISILHSSTCRNRKWCTGYWTLKASSTGIFEREIEFLALN